MGMVADFWGAILKFKKLKRKLKKMPGMPLFYEINGAVNKFSFGMQIVMLHLEAS